MIHCSTSLKPFDTNNYDFLKLDQNYFIFPNVDSDLVVL